MSFEAPFVLLVLLVLPLALASHLAIERRRARYAINFTNMSVLAEVVALERKPLWRRYLPLGLLLAAIAVLCAAVARPTFSLTVSDARSTVVLVTDVSDSMRAEDVTPTRLGAAQEAIRSFLDASPDDLRVGLIAFADEPQVIVPPTRDRELLGRGVELLEPGAGTALGDAVVRAVELAESGREMSRGDRALESPGRGQEPPTAILLLSDGKQIGGLVEPSEGAAVARERNVPVYAIALGTDAGTVEVFERGELKVHPARPDRAALIRIAAATGGLYFDAPDAGRLASVYQHLGSELGRLERRHEATVGLVLVGVALLVGAGILSGVWVPRLP